MASGFENYIRYFAVLDEILYIYLYLGTLPCSTFYVPYSLLYYFYFEFHLPLRFVDRRFKY